MNKYNVTNNNKYHCNFLPKISIVMTYYERLHQIKNTLNSFKKYINNEFEVIIIDDGSEFSLNNIINDFDYSITLVEMDKYSKNYYNSCVPFNIGFSFIRGEITIIQNAECLHYTNIFQEIYKSNLFKFYISFSCYSLSREDTNEFSNQTSQVHFKNISATKDGESAWYNHEKYRPTGYHFCSAILTKHLKNLNGFDIRYAMGIGYDDDELLYRIKENELKLIINNNGIVLHQWHYTNKNYDKNLVNRNRFLFKFITKKKYSYFIFKILSKKIIFDRTIIDIFFHYKDKYL